MVCSELATVSGRSELAKQWLTVCLSNDLDRVMAAAYSVFCGHKRFLNFDFQYGFADMAKGIAVPAHAHLATKLA